MSESLRVALLHNYRDQQQPSMRLYALRLGEALTRRRLRVTRIQPPEVLPEKWRRASPLWSKLDGYAGRFAVYPRLLRKLDADVVHIVDHGQAHLIGTLDRRRTVITCHDVILLALAAGRIGAAQQAPPVALQVFRLAVEHVKLAAAVVADSTQTKRDLTTFVGVEPERIIVIHPGLNQAFRRDPESGQALRRRLGLGDGLLMLHIGRAFYKNILGVVRVLHRLRAGGVDVRLARVGPGLTNQERALADRLGVIDNIVQLRGVSDEDMPALYNAVDLLLFPSLYEGFGWPPLEAMASGAPVVCSRAGSLDEVVGDAALTADPEDIDALTWHAAAALTEGKLRAKLIERGLAHAARFNWDRTAEQMIAVYRDVAAKAN